MIKVAFLASVALLLAGCTTGTRLQGAAPPPGAGAAVLAAHIVQSDARERSGTVTLRKIDLATGRFLPEAADTVAEVKLLPAFRFADVLRRGDLTGQTRTTPADLTALALSPGVWAVARARTAAHVAGSTYSSDSLARLSQPSLETLGFEVLAGRIVALPPLTVDPTDGWGAPGPATVRHRDDLLPSVVALAAQRGWNAEPVDWREITVQCRLEPRHGRPEVRC